MTIQHLLDNSIQWQPHSQTTPFLANGSWNLFTDANSLTCKLQTLATVQLKLLFCEWGEVYSDEARILNLAQTKKPTWIRHINWVSNETVWVHARIVIPDETPISKILMAVREQSIGEILFAEEDWQRLPFEFAKIYDIPQKKWFYGRRSLFKYNEQPLLITEIFTSEFFEYYEKICLTPA